MRFEDRIIKFEPKPLSENKDLMERLLTDKSRKVDAYRPKEENFIDIYEEEEIKNDLAEIKRLKSLWEKETEEEKYIKDIADIYEGVIIDQIEANAWLGEDCETVATSEYDDIKNGIDVIGIFSQGESRNYLGLGVDVTFASNKEVLEKKFESIKQCIRSGALPTIKYFEDPNTEEHHKIYLPKVIIGSRLSSAEKLIQLWGGKDSSRNRKLQEHPVQSKIILESISQLEYFYNFAINLSVSNRNPEKTENYKKIAEEYRKMKEIFYSIYKDKKDLIESHLNEVSDDIVYETILELTGKRKK